jgi:hypothetical protein
VKHYCRRCGGLIVVRMLWGMFNVLGCKVCRRVML